MAHRDGINDWVSESPVTVILVEVTETGGNSLWCSTKVKILSLLLEFQENEVMKLFLISRVILMFNVGYYMAKL